MTKRFIGFGSISQFGQVAKDVKHMAQYIDYDEVEKRPNLDGNAPMPTIDFIMSEKIHGSNASVCYSHTDGMWFQSRKNIITPEKDNAGCAFACSANDLWWMGIIDDLINEYQIDCHKYIISVYFEWSGGNIQKKSTLTGLDKRSMIFQYFKVSPIEPQMGNDGAETPESAQWLETKASKFIGTRNNELDGSSEELYTHRYVSNKDKNIFNIMDFPTRTISIDFAQANMSQNAMIKMVDELEMNSLVGKQFGIDGNIGEGYVAQAMYQGILLRFKVKGEEHSKGSGKVKTLSPVDEAKENLKRKIANDVTTEGRLEQMFTEIIHSVYNGNEDLMSMDDMKTFLPMVVRDIIKEETDLLVENGFEIRDITKQINAIAVPFFKSKVLGV